MDRRELRSFALPRIRNVRASKTRFRRPADFSISRFLDQSFGVFAKPTKTRHTVRILFDRFAAARVRSEEHTSELLSRGHLVCRLLLEKKKKKNNFSTLHYGEKRKQIRGTRRYARHQYDQR